MIDLAESAIDFLRFDQFSVSVGASVLSRHFYKKVNIAARPIALCLQPKSAGNRGKPKQSGRMQMSVKYAAAAAVLGVVAASSPVLAAHAAKHVQVKKHVSATETKASAAKPAAAPSFGAPLPQGWPQTK